MSTIARTAAGTPVASTATGGPPGPRPARALGRRPPRASVHTQRLALRARGCSSSRRSCRSITSTSAPRSSATSATHCPIGPAPSTTTRSPARDPASAARRARRSTPARPSPRRAASATAIGNTWSWPVRQPLLQPTVDVDPDQLEVVARVRAPDAARVAVARTRAAATAPPAGRPRAPAGNPGPARRSSRRPRAPGRGGTANRRRRRTARRRRSGSPSRRCRPPPGARPPRRARAPAGRARSSTAIDPTRSVTAARIATSDAQPQTSAAVSTISSSLATCSS